MNKIARLDYMVYAIYISFPTITNGLHGVTHLDYMMYAFYIFFPAIPLSNQGPHVYSPFPIWHSCNLTMPLLLRLWSFTGLSHRRTTAYCSYGASPASSMWRLHGCFNRPTTSARSFKVLDTAFLTIFSGSDTTLKRVQLIHSLSKPTVPI